MNLASRSVQRCTMRARTRTPDKPTARTHRYRFRGPRPVLPADRTACAAVLAQLHCERLGTCASVFGNRRNRHLYPANIDGRAHSRADTSDRRRGAPLRRGLNRAARPLEGPRRARFGGRRERGVFAGARARLRLRRPSLFTPSRLASALAISITRSISDVLVSLKATHD